MKWVIVLIIICLILFSGCSREVLESEVSSNVVLDNKYTAVSFYEESVVGSGVFVEVDPDEVEEHAPVVELLEIDNNSDTYFWDDLDSSYFVVMD